MVARDLQQFKLSSICLANYRERNGKSYVHMHVYTYIETKASKLMEYNTKFNTTIKINKITNANK